MPKTILDTQVFLLLHKYEEKALHTAAEEGFDAVIVNLMQFGAENQVKYVISTYSQ